MALRKVLSSQVWARDDLALDHVYHVLCDVGGMVCNSLQVSGGGQEMYQALHPVCVFPYAVLDLDEHIPVHRVYLIIGGTDLPRQSTVHVHQGIEAPFDHRLGLFRQKEGLLLFYALYMDIIVLLGSHAKKSTQRYPRSILEYCYKRDAKEIRPGHPGARC